MDRKLVKQTVMTSVYGVTYVGAREQLRRRLKEKGVITDEDLLFRTSCYAAKVKKKSNSYSLLFNCCCPCKLLIVDHILFFHLSLLLNVISIEPCNSVLQYDRPMPDSCT